MAYWLVKTDPGDYTFEDLQNEAVTVWEGVTNNLALAHLRTMVRGDRVFMYHTGTEKAIVGIARVTHGAYPDPNQTNQNLVVVDLEAVDPLPRPITLKEIKARKDMATLELLRVPRLSVMPVSPKHWRILIDLSGYEE